MEFDRIDYARSSHLADVGAPDYAAALVIDPRGREFFVLAHVNDDDSEYDVRCRRCAPHEQLGKLPPEWQERLQRPRILPT
jgi:hypothetical protein